MLEAPLISTSAAAVCSLELSTSLVPLRLCALAAALVSPVGCVVSPTGSAPAVPTALSSTLSSLEALESVESPARPLEPLEDEDEPVISESVLVPEDAGTAVVEGAAAAASCSDALSDARVADADRKLDGSRIDIAPKVIDPLTGCS
jgi:hypothetical protein